MDLYSRQIVGWAAQPTMTADLILQTSLAAGRFGESLHRQAQARSASATGEGHNRQRIVMQTWKLILLPLRRGVCSSPDLTTQGGAALFEFAVEKLLPAEVAQVLHLARKPYGYCLTVRLPFRRRLILDLLTPRRRLRGDD